MSTKRIAAITLLGATTLVGCFRTSITVEGGSGTTPIDHDAAWHHGALYGLVDFSSPHKLHEICPGGTVKVYSETSFVNGLVQAITFSLYNPQEVTIECLQGETPTEAVVEPAAAPPDDPGVEPAPGEDTVPEAPDSYSEPPPPPPAG